MNDKHTAMAAAANGAKPRGPFSEPLMWLVVGIPALTVVAGLVTLYIATTHADPVISGGYQKRGMAVERLPGNSAAAAGAAAAGGLAADGAAAGAMPAAPLLPRETR